MSEFTCSVCGKRKDLTEFQIGRTKCKKCYNAWMREYKKTRSEKIKKESKAYREKNKDILNKKFKEWYYENKLKFRPED